MKKKQFRHRGCKVKIKETKKHTEIDIVMPDNTQFGKKLIDTRPDKTISMVDNECLQFQVMSWINEKLDYKPDVNTLKQDRKNRKVRKRK